MPKHRNIRSKKTALITGITGQDGSYLAELLLEKGYEVHGVKRRSSSLNTQRLDHLYQGPQVNGRQLVLHYGDLTDSAGILRLVNEIRPDEIYNLGAQSHVRVSFEMPEYTSQVNALGALRLLESIRVLGLGKTTRYYQASTSELYGMVRQTPQDESTPFYPRSPYATAKLFAYWTTVNYREAYGVYACNGILFNHESPRRGETFVTRKVTRGLAELVHGIGSAKCLYMGNLDAKRDWGHARDFVNMQWLMLQQEQAKDYVIATGRQYSVRELVTTAARLLGLTLEFRGTGEAEEGVITALAPDHRWKVDVGDVIVRVDPQYLRPAEADAFLGDARRAEQELGWQPQVTFEELIQEMLNEDVACIGRLA